MKASEAIIPALFEAGENVGRNVVGDPVGAEVAHTPSNAKFKFVSVEQLNEVMQ